MGDGRIFSILTSSMASVLAKRSRVHDAILGGAVLSTPPGRVEAKIVR